MAPQPKEIATGVYWLPIRGSNVYFVRSGSSWALIDTSWANNCRLIKKTAESLFGANTPPVSILLMHSYPDHAGSALELARMWGCPVYVHPDELPLTAGDLSTFQPYVGPLDRWVILPLLCVIPPRALESMLAKTSLKDVTQGRLRGISIDPQHLSIISSAPAGRTCDDIVTEKFPTVMGL